jgi:uncharacterized RDD family membrane protein YckC
MTCPQCGTLNPNERDDCVRCKTKLRSPEMAGKIACANHGNREATTSCGACGERRCEQCAVNANGVDFCDAHAPAGARRPSYDEDYERVPVVDVAANPRAGFGTRLLAFALDALLVFFAAVVLALAFWVPVGSVGFINRPDEHPYAYWLYWGLLTIGAAAYTVLLTAMNGQTVGKQMAGVIILQPDGRMISLRIAMVRFAVSLVSALAFGLGFLWAIWDKDRETWHDKAARTVAFHYEESA